MLCERRQDSQGVRSPYVTQSLKDLEAQAASDKATIERLKSVPAEAMVLPHPAQLVDRALNLQELFKHDPVAGREALRRLLGGRPIVLRPDAAGHYVAEATLFPLLALDRESSGKVRGTAVGCAGPQLDFPAQQFQVVTEVWVPFEEAIVIGWR